MADKKITREEHPVYKEAYRKGQIDAYKEAYRKGLYEGAESTAKTLHGFYMPVITALETELNVARMIAKAVKEEEKNG